jgi:hypothetical protein
MLEERFFETADFGETSSKSGEKSSEACSHPDKLGESAEKNVMNEEY